MITKVIEVLIVKESGDGVIDCERVEQPNTVPRIRVDWNNTALPEGFQAIGDGVAFYEASEFRKVRRATGAKLNPAGAGSFTWRDTEHDGLLTLIVIFPAGVGVELESLNPAPKGAKIFRDKQLAIYWELEEEDHVVGWKPIEVKDLIRLTDIVAKINRKEESAAASKDTGNRETKIVFTPDILIEIAQKTVPGFKWSIGAAGILGLAAATIGGHPILGAGIILVLAFAQLFLYWVSKLDSQKTTPMAVLMAWTILILLLLSFICLFLASVINKPWPVRDWIIDQFKGLSIGGGNREVNLKGVRVEFQGMYAVDSAAWPDGKQVQLTLNWASLAGRETNRLGGITNFSVNPSVTLPKDGQLPGFDTANFIVPLPGELAITNLAELRGNIRIIVHAEFHGGGRAQLSDSIIDVPLGEVVKKLQKGAASEIVISDRMQVQPGDNSKLTHVYAVKVSPIQ